MTIHCITVVGAGTMGAGIAQVAAMSGFKTELFDRSSEVLERATNDIARRLDREVQRERMTAEAAAATRARLVPTRDLDAALAQADLLIEAIPETLNLKQELFLRAERVAKQSCVFGTNTSTLMISAIAAPLKDRSRLIGIHFFNPVPAMKLIEVVMGRETSETAYAAATAVAVAMGKETVRIKEAPGFATSRINALIGAEAFRMLEQGVASADDLDKAIRLGLAHPMGPFEMVDLVGLDARLNNQRALYEALKDPAFKPTALLERLVAEGRLGKKSGRGIYRYDAEGRRLREGDDL